MKLGRKIERSCDDHDRNVRRSRVAASSEGQGTTQGRRMSGPLNRAWVPVILLIFGSILMMAVGTTGDDSQGAQRATRASQPSLASAPLGPDVVHWLTASASPSSRTTGLADAASSARADSPFPILSFVGGVLLAMVFALHLAAWRFAH